jgi:DNA polymerase/3'-5' exonuclease PolX
MSTPWRSEKVRRPRAEVEPLVKMVTHGIEIAMRGANVFATNRIIVGGSWRRGAPEIGDLDILVVTESGFLDFPLQIPFFKIQHQGDRIIQGDYVFRIPGEGSDDQPGDSAQPWSEAIIHVDIWSCKPIEKGGMLCFITGPKALNIMMRRKAIDKGLTLSQYGLFEGDKQLDLGTEVGVFGGLGMSFLSPEARQQYADKPPETPVRRHSVQVQSDSDPGQEYTVTVERRPGGEDFWTCVCKAFKYSKSIPATCKHINRIKPQLMAELARRGFFNEQGEKS